MTTFLRDWSAAYEAIPANVDDASEGASRIRNSRTDTRERIDVDHYLPGTAPADKTEEGEHRKITFYAQIADPTNVADKGFLYIKDVSAKVELFWENEDGDVIQLTSLATVSPLLATANTWSALQTHTSDIRMSSSQDQWAIGADVASAAALPVLDDGNYFDVTGTTTITSIDTQGVGTVIRLHFDGILTLTHHATNLILPSAANIVTAVGDELTFVEYATGNWRCVAYALASGKAVVETAGDFEFVSTAAITAATTLSTLGLVAGYDYSFTLEAFSITDDAQELWMLFSDDGSTWEAGAADYSWAVWNNRAGSNATLETDLSDSEIQLTGPDTLGNDASLYNTITVELINPMGTSEPTTAMWRGFYHQAAAAGLVPIVGGGTFLQGADNVQGVQFLWSGGSTFKAQGDITVWRRKRS